MSGRMERWLPYHDVMDWILTPAGGTLLSVAAMAVAVALFLWRRRAFAGGALLSLMMAAVAGYALIAGLEATFADLRWKIVWSTLEYVGSGSVATLFLLFASHYSGLDRWLRGRRQIAVWCLVAVAFAFVSTNSIHHWVWMGFEHGPEGSNSILYIHGPAFYAILGAFYAYVFVGCSLLLRAAVRPVAIRRRQSVTVLLGAVFPIIGGALYSLGITPVVGLNLIPVSFFFTVLVFSIGVWPFRLFDLVPIARDALVEGMPDAVVVLDTERRIVDVNPSARELLGGEGSMIGRRIETYPVLWRRIQDECRGGIGGRAEFTLTETPLCYVDVRVSSLRGPDVRPSGCLVMIRDITKRHVAEAELQRANQRLEEQISRIELLQGQLREQAIRDALTGLFNRRYLDEILPRELQRAEHGSGIVSLVLFDIDHFKRVNDSCGHEAGDRILRGLGELLRERTRPADVACRYGGEEFLLVLPGTLIDAAVGRAEEIRSRFGTLSAGLLPQREDETRLTLSAGVSACPVHAHTQDAVVRCADDALYCAKENGRNQVCVFGT